MTKFSKKFGEVKKESRQTVFKKVIDSDFTINEAVDNPSDYENINWVGHDQLYGDVFFCYDNDKENNFVIFFGTAGDEFNQ